MSRYAYKSEKNKVHECTYIWLKYLIFKLKFVLELNSKEYIIHMTSQGIKVDLTSPRMTILRHMIDITIFDIAKLKSWGFIFFVGLKRKLKSLLMTSSTPSFRRIFRNWGIKLDQSPSIFSFFLGLSCNHKEPTGG